MTALRFYRLALVASVCLNVVLVTGIALYIHFAGLLDAVETAVGFLN